MRKHISIDELSVGMKVLKLDKSWAETPFLRHRMRVTAVQQIEALRACGVRVLDVETDEAEVRLDPGKEQEPPLTQPPFSSEPEAQGSSEQEAVPGTSFGDELPAARQVYRAAKQVIGQAMLDVRMGRDINMEAVNQVVSEMADSVLRNPDALTSLSRLKRFDEYTFFHSVNTSLLGLALGRSLGFDRDTLHRLGVGTLLHDIGKTRIPLEILNKPGRFEANEFEIMQQHVMRGIEILSGTTGLAEPYLKPTLEHHERVDGTGYPYRKKKAALSEFGLIASIVDIYDAITSDRCYHKAKPPHEALQFIYQLAQRGHVDGYILQRFVQVVGVYPVGSIVGLHTGETAVVCQINHHRPLEPRVRIVKTSGNALLASPEFVDLADQIRRPRRIIHSVLSPEASGITPADYLDKEGS
jgi:HD-GYP domain-containing protein (c-di-GMP phosphodiesterase class II)